MSLRWSPGVWKSLGGIIHIGLAPYEKIIAVVQGDTPEETDANTRLMTAAPETVRLLVDLYPDAPILLRERIHACLSRIGVTLEDFKVNGQPHVKTQN